MVTSQNNIIAQGAEAILYKEETDTGLVLVKERIVKTYRHPDLDNQLRKFRTKREAKLLKKAAECGVPVPRVHRTDLKDMKLIMDFLDGEKLKIVANRDEPQSLIPLFEQLGQLVGTLHNNNIIHGDLTTSNVIMVNNVPTFIDFGLGYVSSSIEDKAVDLHLLERAIESTHYQHADILYNAVVNGYKSEVTNWKEMETRIAQVESRRRYVDKEKKKKKN